MKRLDPWSRRSCSVSSCPGTQRHSQCCRGSSPARLCGRSGLVQPAAHWPPAPARRSVTVGYPCRGAAGCCRCLAGAASAPRCGAASGSALCRRPGGTRRCTASRTRGPSGSRQGDTRRQAGDDVGHVGGVVEQPFELLLPFYAADSRDVGRPLHLALVVCGHGPVSHPCRAVRSNIDGGEPAGPVKRGDVVRHVHGNPAEHPDGLVNRLAHLEYVAHDDRDTEPLTDFPPAAEGQRDRQPRIVNAVEQPPRQSAMPSTRRPV